MTDAMRKQGILVILSLVLITGITAQDQTPALSLKRPELGGHAFPSLLGLRSSFINTSLMASMGFGNTSSVKIKGIMIDDYEILSFEGKMLFYDMKVQYQQRFTPWLALHFSFVAAGRVGTDMSTIMADGVNTLSGGSIGWLVRFLRTDRLNLSANVSVNRLTGNFINVTDYFSDLINNVPDPQITRKIPAMAVGAGLSGAYAFNPMFGLQFSAEYAFGESFERKKNEGYFFTAIAADADFNPRHRVPIGLAVSYTLSSAPEIVLSDGGLSNMAMVGASYTGSEEFELGLQYTYYNVDIQSAKDNLFVGKIMLLMKFYF
jgi:hypothetical protein